MPSEKGNYYYLIKGVSYKADDANDTSPSKKTTSWKSKFKKSIKTPSGLADVMALLVEEEKSNQALVAAIQDQHNTPPEAPALPTPPAPMPPAQSTVSVTSAFPATTLKLQSILKKK